MVIWKAFRPFNMKIKYNSVKLNIASDFRMKYGGVNLSLEVVSYVVTAEMGQLLYN